MKNKNFNESSCLFSLTTTIHTTNNKFSLTSSPAPLLSTSSHLSPSLFSLLSSPLLFSFSPLLSSSPLSIILFTLATLFKSNLECFHLLAENQSSSISGDKHFPRFDHCPPSIRKSKKHFQVTRLSILHQVCYTFPFELG
jgi:hypothetical protein